MNNPHPPTNMSYQREIEEAVIATYPVDLFPYNKTAETMRKMAPAIASIVLPVIERAVEAERERTQKNFSLAVHNTCRKHKPEELKALTTLLNEPCL